MSRKPLIPESVKSEITNLRKQGVMYKDIALKVGYSTRTVRNWHYKETMRKAGIL